MNKKAFKIGFAGIWCAFLAMLCLVSVNKGSLDLNVSRLLSRLAQGSRDSNNLYGKFIETFGELPMYIGATWIFATGLYVTRDSKNRFIRYIVGLLSGILMVLAGSMGCKNCVKYLIRHGVIIDCSWILQLVIGTVLAAGVYALLQRFQPDHKAAIQFAVVAALMIGFSQLLIHEVLKTLFSRQRYRAIAYLSGDFSQFSPWYHLNKVSSLPERAIADDFRSFPSGHTASAGTTYLLMLFPYYFKRCNTKRCKVICFVLPIFVTGMVAVGRIIVGAHYFSDVLFGGTISLICTWGFYFLQQKILHQPIFDHES